MTTQPTYNFNNKTAIVTGAGGGMGKEITLALSKFGAKDVKLACEMGRENKVPMDMSNILEQNLIEILNRGWGRKNSGILRKLIAEKAGIEFEYAPGGFA